MHVVMRIPAPSLPQCRAGKNLRVLRGGKIVASFAWLKYVQVLTHREDEASCHVDWCLATAARSSVCSDFFRQPRVRTLAGLAAAAFLCFSSPLPADTCPVTSLSARGPYNYLLPFPGRLASPIL
ncbi:hypothetical protein BaRGS_00011413 [Batillaria attramentaria]|uniref:Uncharacterized protein n=1 Tax=Batillaria attramentaria TaxID=370345 RepID=A0ABD0LCT1_9CAEN